MRLWWFVVLQHVITFILRGLATRYSIKYFTRLEYDISYDDILLDFTLLESSAKLSGTEINGCINMILLKKKKKTKKHSWSKTGWMQNTTTAKLR